jgi:hypothetical protein
VKSHQKTHMAIEIKRSPVLEGEAALAFNQSLQKQTHVSRERVRLAIEESKKIRLTLRKKSK